MNKKTQNINWLSTLNSITINEQTDEILKGTIVLSANYSYDKKLDLGKFCINTIPVEIPNLYSKFFTQAIRKDKIFKNPNSVSNDELYEVILSNIEFENYRDIAKNNTKFKYGKVTNKDIFVDNIHFFHTDIFNPNYVYTFSIDFISNLKDGVALDITLNTENYFISDVEPFDESYKVGHLFDEEEIMDKIQDELLGSCLFLINNYMKLYNEKLTT